MDKEIKTQLKTFLILMISGVIIESISTYIDGNEFDVKSILFKSVFMAIFLTLVFLRLDSLRKE